MPGFSFLDRPPHDCESVERRIPSAQSATRRNKVPRLELSGRVLILIVLCLGTTPALVFGQDISNGQREYEENCATCHGLSGRGDGPLSRYLTRSPPDLTQLAKANQGRFPFEKVYEIIDGRRMLQLHGTREMPVWGREFTSSKYFAEHREPYNAESFARDRLLNLVAFIRQLQAD